MSTQKPEKPDMKAAFDRVMQRLRDNLKQAEYKSWDYLQDKIEEAVEVELTAEEMTRDEVGLLSAYVKRDLRRLGHYAHETGEGVAAFLKFDLNALEQRLAGLLTDLADRTRIEQETLREQLDHTEDQYIEGEVATAGTLECLECGASTVLMETEILRSCAQCGGRYFRRVSAEWTPPEV
ncbi:zinc ribbon-containing protein [Marinobacterium jannaschii]|uniref:zinc ribbon-containing protein n=1 Tax=Marinobacterium jannaschii TaxID=64970 RepID=UPI00056420EB|nr:zinc ribbon-containing protein [Marinobacterium jannaschii]